MQEPILLFGTRDRPLRRLQRNGTSSSSESSDSLRLPVPRVRCEKQPSVRGREAVLSFTLFPQKCKGLHRALNSVASQQYYCRCFQLAKYRGILLQIRPLANNLKNALQGAWRRGSRSRPDSTNCTLGQKRQNRRHARDPFKRCQVECATG